MPAPVDILKIMALNTWNRLKAAQAMGVSQNEETLTDVNLLDIYLQSSSEITLWKCPKREEARIGIDWEWFIGNDTEGWYRYAVQAKKLSNGRYRTLNHMVRRRGSPSIRQVDVLERYAAENNAIPIYIFYNYIEKPTQMKMWFQAETAQLGCTIAILQSVKRILEKHKQPGFDNIYDDDFTIPLYRLLRLPNKDFSETYQNKTGFYPSIPDSVQKKLDKSAKKARKTKAGKKSRAYQRIVGSEETTTLERLEIAPRRIMIMKV